MNYTCPERYLNMTLRELLNSHYRIIQLLAEALCNELCRCEKEEEEDRPKERK